MKKIINLHIYKYITPVRITCVRQLLIKVQRYIAFTTPAAFTVITPTRTEFDFNKVSSCVNNSTSKKINQR
jgi:hypothetical protein